MQRSLSNLPRTIKSYSGVFLGARCKNAYKSYTGKFKTTIQQKKKFYGGPLYGHAVYLTKHANLIAVYITIRQINRN
jgi:hypothetical protein